MVLRPNPLEAIDQWPVPLAAAAIISPGGNAPVDIQRRGDTGHRFPLASLTKPLFGLAVLVAVEEQSLDLDEPIIVDRPIAGVGPLTHPVTVRQLLSHAGGIGPEAADPVSAPGKRRIYSNAGFELLGGLLAQATELSAADYLHEAIAVPLGLQNTVLEGSPASGAVSSVDDLIRVMQELMRPTLLSPLTLALATTPQFPELDGVVPGYGRQSPNPWGLGFEIRGVKSPHWTGTKHSPRTFGHFGKAGTMFWIDPTRPLAAVALTNRDFGPWAVEAWPPFNDSILG